jgi:hypothetical protein
MPLFSDYFLDKFAVARGVVLSQRFGSAFGSASG